MQKKEYEPFVQVFILAYERPDLFKKTLISVLSQTFKNFQVIVSDNSKSDVIEQIMKSFDDPRLIYRHRIPSLNSLDHFNKVLNEVEADYFMMFHDDDVMCPECLEKLLKGFSLYPDAAAVGGNAQFLFQTKLSHRKFYNRKTDFLVKCPKTFLNCYFNGYSNHPPFPAYLYNSSMVKNIFLEPKLGKYADAVYLSNVCLASYLVFVKDVVMHYRLHSKQDSFRVSLNDRWLFFKWLKEKRIFCEDDPKLMLNRLIILYLRRRFNSSKKLFNKINFYLLWWRLIYQIRVSPLSFLRAFLRMPQKLMERTFLANKERSGN